MKNFSIDFDKIIDRRNTGSLKYDFALQRGLPKDILPLWVADMDFPTAEPITNAIIERASHGIFGYTESDDNYFDAVAGWMFFEHDWKVEKKWLVKTPGVVYALAMAVQAYTNEGDHVLIQQPVYYPFKEVVECNGRIPVSNDLFIDDEHHYQINFDDFENKIKEYNIKLFLLCSPHNPVGRVWTRNELLKLGEICKKHGVIVVSDEIHEDFVFPGSRHFVFANVVEEFKDISIICTSPSKTFNLAGLQISNIFISNPALRKQFKNQIAASGYSQLNTLGLTACEAAYRHGKPWYEAVKKYILENIVYLNEYLENHIPEIKPVKTEGTYLVWLDFRALGLNACDQKKLLVEKAGLWLDSGTMFGKTGQGFERINVACPRQTLDLALKKLQNAVYE